MKSFSTIIIVIQKLMKIFMTLAMKFLDIMVIQGNENVA